ncbi:MAG: hypothetical protein R3C59_22155 [Planctomycetaceae bacterium]
MPVKLNLTASVTPSKYTTKSIRDLRVGERVLARNPEVSDSSCRNSKEAGTARK